MSELSTARAVAGSVPDPELPMLTLADLGIVRDVAMVGSQVVVSLTPTYSGCPAVHEMSIDVAQRLRDAGYEHVAVRTVLHPPWTTDWITDSGRSKLAAAGISPPGAAPRRGAGPVPLTLGPTSSAVRCPRCQSPSSDLVSAFSGTACKALYRCRSCGEPFEHMKEV